MIAVVAFVVGFCAGAFVMLWFRLDKAISESYIMGYRRRALEETDGEGRTQH